MSTYHVTFYKKLLSSDGHPFKCVQGDLYMDAQHPRQAAESAFRRFERTRGVHDWRELADYFDLEVTDDHSRSLAVHRRTKSKNVVDARRPGV